jgi:tetratricopeptide (TPR) repeat protein
MVMVVARRHGGESPLGASMSILKKLFGRNETPSLVVKPDPPPQPGNPSAPEMVQVFDQFGRLLQMPKETWRTQVLGPNLTAKRNDPEALSGLIVSALRDGCAADVLESARHLATCDPQPLRAANLLGVVLLQLKRHDEAKHILEQATAKYGEEGSVLTNLAKAYSGLGDSEKSEATLWRAIERDPNQDNGLLWFAAIEKDRGGPPAQLAAFERVARLPNSWRSQLWLAREVLSRKDVARATELYREALGRMNPVPTDALMQISGDLGNSGELSLLLELCTPQFDLQRHGIQVGNNLIKANLDLGRTKEARAILEKLYAQQRPDWRQVLTDWERRIDDAERRYGPVAEKLSVQFVSLDQPLCTHGRLGFEALLPEKPANAPRVTFICGTGTPSGPEAAQAHSQRSDALGQVTRVIPLYFAEEVLLRYNAQTRVLIPVVQGGGGGFVLAGVAWRPEDLPQGVHDCQAVVMLHADARATPWNLKFSLLGWPTASLLAEWVVPFKLEEPMAAMQAAYERLTHELSALSELRATSMPKPFILASAADTQRYVLSLESALVIATASVATSERAPIWGERGLIDTLLDVAASVPASVRCRLLLLNSIEREARRRPDIVKEYLEMLSLLQQRHPLPAGPAADLISAAMKAIRASATGH